jgi:DNA-binding NarL/FixJ family response regulator
VIRVVVVDDHAVVREGLELLLSRFDGIECVGTAANGEGALPVVSALQPDVVLMDLSMPVMDGVEATGQIIREHPDVRVVVLTTFSDRSRVLRAVDAGASGYLLKDASPDQIAEAIRAAARGEAPVDPRAAAALLRRGEERPADKLTPREREVIDLVGAGLANKQIARRLGISEKTVKTHLTKAFQVIGVTDRVQAALWVEREASPP